MISVTYLKESHVGSGDSSLRRLSTWNQSLLSVHYISGTVNMRPKITVQIIIGRCETPNLNKHTVL